VKLLKNENVSLLVVNLTPLWISDVKLREVFVYKRHWLGQRKYHSSLATSKQNKQTKLIQKKMAFIKFFFFVLLVAFAVAQLPELPIKLPELPLPLPGAGGGEGAAPAAEGRFAAFHGN
jgi:hypothetical protein